MIDQAPEQANPGGRKVHGRRAGPSRHGDAQGAGGLPGAIVGVLRAVDGGSPLVSFPGSPSEVAARTTVDLGESDVGREVLLLFEHGAPHRPIITGLLRRAGPPAEPRRLVLGAGEEIVLRCGRATITLTRAGKVLVRGAYILSRSSGVNRVKGGSVQIN